MTKQVLDYDALAQRIGHVSLNWSRLEGAIKGFIYDLCAYQSEAFETDDPPFHILLTFLENMDIRKTLANAKALAFEVKDIPGFYDRVEKALNLIDDDLRNERNRYIHDRWHLSGPIITRVKSGTAVRRAPSSGEKEMTHRTIKRYLGSFELMEFAQKIEDATAGVEAFGEELRLRLNETRPRE